MLEDNIHRTILIIGTVGGIYAGLILAILLTYLEKLSYFRRLKRDYLYLSDSDRTLFKDMLNTSQRLEYDMYNIIPNRMFKHGHNFINDIKHKLNHKTIY